MRLQPTLIKAANRHLNYSERRHNTLHFALISARQSLHFSNKGAALAENANRSHSLLAPNFVSNQSDRFRVIGMLLFLSSRVGNGPVALACPKLDAQDINGICRVEKLCFGMYVRGNCLFSI